MLRNCPLKQCEVFKILTRLGSINSSIDNSINSAAPVPRDRMPRHVGIIMDGNGRWAKLRKRPRVFGHKSGVDSVRQVVKAAGEWGVETLTLYAFSDENWGRPVDEVKVIMGLLDTYVRKERDELDRNNVRFRTIGEIDRLKPATRDLIQDVTKKLAGNTGLLLNLAISYGGRMEITRAVQQLAAKALNGEIRPDEISSELISDHLYTAGMTDPDLIIRTSGEQRISNFLLWQSAYSELFFSEVLWPDFGRKEFAHALADYDIRERRFGLVPQDRKPSQSYIVSTQC
ncbi:MAG: isoprenyl transferase [Proteobacteria bacterium]|nr:isoprenyl transferase [Pseudomonadota bacterium]